MCFISDDKHPMHFLIKCFSNPLHVGNCRADKEWPWQTEADTTQVVEEAQAILASGHWGCIHEVEDLCKSHSCWPIQVLPPDW